MFFKLQSKGRRPIVVHPERNLAIQDKTQILANLVEKGALAQITASSIAGAFGREPQEVSRELLQQNLVHIIASDAHAAMGIRKPNLSVGVDAAARVIGREAALKMVEDIPQAILENRKPDLAGLPKVSRQKWWSLRL